MAYRLGLTEYVACAQQLLSAAAADSTVTTGICPDLLCGGELT